MLEAKKIAVLGAGIMGSGIAQVAAQAGYAVTLRDMELRFLKSGLDKIKKSFSLMEERGKITPVLIEEALRRINSTTDFAEAVADADLVIEAVPENLDLKKQVFEELDQTCPVQTILATNTSAISITTIASATNRPEKVIGMHFSNPVPVMTLVELVRGLETSDETLAIAQAVVKKLGKDFFVARDFPGFVSNRLFPILINEAFYVVWQGIAAPDDVDKMAKSMLHHPMGPFELADFVGLDTVLSMLEYLQQELGEKYRPCPLLKQLVGAGHYGRKTGRGMYEYEVKG